MAKNLFRFKQFVVRQDRTAMKVGTDGTLLGCWAGVGSHLLENTDNISLEAGASTKEITILDIGTGSGLIALIMAQRFPMAQIVGIDIDDDAIAQAEENVALSPFSSRIKIIKADCRQFEVTDNSAASENLDKKICGFDAIVCNPPYFIDSLLCPDSARTLARHANELSYTDLMTTSYRLLAEDGELSLIIPFDYKERLEEKATINGLFKVRECAVKTTVNKKPRRYLLAFRKHPFPIVSTEQVLEESPGQRSTWYKSLTENFYL